MFGWAHHVPILRSKAGEMYALEHLRDHDRRLITPLVEIIPTLFKGRTVNRIKLPDPNPGKVMLQQAKILLRSCKYEPFFLDLQHLDGTLSDVCGAHPVTYIAKLCAEFRVKMIPVIGFQRRSAFLLNTLNPAT